MAREAADNSLGLVMCRLASPNNGKKSEQTAGDWERKSSLSRYSEVSGSTNLNLK